VTLGTNHEIIIYCGRIPVFLLCLITRLTKSESMWGICLIR
jgi:hypothetical protein